METNAASTLNASNKGELDEIASNLPTLPAQTIEELLSEVAEAATAPYSSALTPFQTEGAIVAQGALPGAVAVPSDHPISAAGAEAVPISSQSTLPQVEYGIVDLDMGASASAQAKNDEPNTREEGEIDSDNEVQHDLGQGECNHSQAPIF
jgi:hypothetical protein